MCIPRVNQFIETYITSIYSVGNQPESLGICLIASHKEYLNNQGIVAILPILTLLQKRFTEELSDLGSTQPYCLPASGQAMEKKRLHSALSFEAMPLGKQTSRSLGDEKRVNITV